MENIVKNLL